MFKQMAGINIAHVPYKGASGAMIDLVAGTSKLYRARSRPPALRSAPVARAGWR
jgi:tripartite-type tricarboxylate transporter receptor subunit TctC